MPEFEPLLARLEQERNAAFASRWLLDRDRHEALMTRLNRDIDIVEAAFFAPSARVSDRLFCCRAALVD